MAACSDCFLSKSKEASWQVHPETHLQNEVNKHTLFKAGNVDEL